ncbi:ABC1-domain-containing protein [Thelephora ganbajun]|uniref:ABC1-domain-containing protein n=1 Tax=Thelephora ganbajun TaxID=370292 RepID=A0ACB6Z4E0_THEGA|nr:ABC1-domain-containing protein [Thelephora ganbajun]
MSPFFSLSSTRGWIQTTASRRLAYIGLGVSAAWYLDKEFYASAVSRNLRTLWTCAVIALDYKINFTAENSEGIPTIHERVAERVFDLFTSNGGLYIKIGQAFASNAAVLPPAMQAKFAKLFDDAAQVPLPEVLKVFESQFHRPPSGPGGVFEYFDPVAVASASIAQVHKAKLKEEDGGGWVAVKVQKPEVGKQVDLDLAMFRLVMWAYENLLFDVKTYFVVDFISDHLRRELDFEQEAINGVTTARFIAEEPRLKDKVYVPQVYEKYTTKKVMTAEWIDGVRMTDRNGVKRLMGERVDVLPEGSAAHRFPTLKGGVSTVLKTMVELFSAQIFEWGWVHCDPHPGNMIIRPHPTMKDVPQLVLLDHGLYVRSTPEFQRQYATLWKSLMTLDLKVLGEVATEWGIGEPKLFASATLMRPISSFNDRNDEEAVKLEKEFSEMNDYERSVVMKKRLQNFLVDQDRMPKELLFIGRNLRIVQGNNQMFGSPVNRIKITATWASRSLAEAPNMTLAQRLWGYYNHFIFKSVLFVTDVTFWYVRVKQWLTGREDEGFEDALEKSMRAFAKTNFGVEIVKDAIYSG